MHCCKEKGTPSSETVQVSITSSLTVNKKGISFANFAKAIYIKTPGLLRNRKRKSKYVGSRVDELLMPVLFKRRTHLLITRLENDIFNQYFIFSLPIINFK